ncbi:MAG: hypothetical protein LBU47_01605, partial [Christensenellaceae bacterium]|nr:hypothetical protein [Christensenellaceae bacterium]
ELDGPDEPRIDPGEPAEAAWVPSGRPAPGAKPSFPHPNDDSRLRRKQAALSPFCACLKKPSQPWPFSDTLLFGLVRELDGPDEPSIDPGELAEATWFHRAEVPLGQSLLSLTQTMIHAFAESKLP